MKVVDKYINIDARHYVLGIAVVMRSIRSKRPIEWQISCARQGPVVTLSVEILFGYLS